MNNDLQIFENAEFGKIRTIEENGKYCLLREMWLKCWGIQTQAKLLMTTAKG